MAQRKSNAERDPIPTVSTRWTPLLRKGHAGPFHLRNRLRKADLVGREPKPAHIGRIAQAVLVILLSVALVFVLAHQAASDTPVSSSPVPASLFTQVEASALLPPRSIAPDPVVADRRPPIQSYGSSATPPSRPVATTPSPTAKPKPRPATTAKPTTLARTSSSISGTATFYCNKNGTRGPLSRCPVGRSGGLYAAISPDLGFLRGKHVHVRCGASTVVVTIVDCDCQAKRSIDLFADAFVRLAPLSSGKLHVTLSW